MLAIEDEDCYPIFAKTSQNDSGNILVLSCIQVHIFSPINESKELLRLKTDFLSIFFTKYLCLHAAELSAQLYSWIYPDP